MSHGSWADEFPRLAECYQPLQNTGAYDGWFDNIPQRIYSSRLSREMHLQRESELSALAPEPWKQLKQEILKHRNDNSQKLITLFDEAAGYCVLKNMLTERSIPYDAIKMPSGAFKNPEWVAFCNHDLVAALEVKTIFESEAQRNFINSNTQACRNRGQAIVKRAQPEIATALLNKISEQVKRGMAQLSAVEGPVMLRVVYVIVNLDYEAAQAANSRFAIESHLANLNEPNGVIVKGDLRSPYV